MKRNIYLMYAIAFLQGMVFYGPVATLYRQAALYFLSKIIFWQASGFVGFLAERVLLTVISYGMAAFLFGRGSVRRERDSFGDFPTTYFYKMVTAIQLKTRIL